MMQRTGPTLSVFAVLALLSMASGSRRRRTTCDGGHNKCGSAFSHFHCPGTCCHDDFNAWCCPEGPWECHGVFHGPDHCDNTKSCRCTDTKYYITKVEAQGEPKTEYAPAWNLNECCTPSSSLLCGWGPGTNMQWTQTQTVSWSNTFSAGVEVEAKGGLLVEGFSVKISLKDSYTNGEQKTTTVSQTISTPCQGTFQNTTHLSFSAQVAMYEVPVTITYSHCGSVSTTSGTVKSTAFAGNYDCSSKTCVAPATACNFEKGCIPPSRRLHGIVV